MTAVLRISDGTTTISLLNGSDGFFLNVWRPSIAQYKGGGTWQSSPLSDGRRMVTRQFGNAVEAFDLKVSSTSSQDDIILTTQELRRLLEKAVDYWTTDWQDEPVWIEAQATCETNLRYAVIHSWSTPDDDNPFNSPFLQPAGAVMDDWSLIVERGHWQDQQPETGTCLPVAASSRDGVVFPSVVFTPAASNDDATWWTPTGGYDSVGGSVQFGAGATVLYNSWIRFDTVNIPQGSRILHAVIRFVCSQAGAGTTVTLRVVGEDSVAPADPVDASDLQSRIETEVDVAWTGLPAWVLGVQYDTPNVANIVEEIVKKDDWVSGNNLAIMVKDDGSTVNARREGASWDNVTYNEPELIVYYKEPRGSTVASCTIRAFTANKRNDAQLTHVYRDEGAGLVGNLIETALPYNLLRAVPVVNDAVYFGIQSDLSNTGPFSSVVLDLTSIGTDFTIIWEYNDGAGPPTWATLDVQDNTWDDGEMNLGNTFDTLGVRSVHWDPPSDWVPTVLPLVGVTGYWVRARVSAIGAPPVGPVTQDNRHPYTIIWPVIDVDDSDIGGDIPAIAQLQATNVSDRAIVPGPSHYYDYLIMGSRTYSRGNADDFTAYINCADEQNPYFITNTTHVLASFADDTMAPSGRRLDYAPGGVVAMTEIIKFYIEADNARAFYGLYHVFVRAYQSSGSDNDYSVRVRLGVGGFATPTAQQTFTYTDTALVTDTAKYLAIDLGRLLIPGSALVQQDEEIRIELTIQSESFGTLGTLRLYDLVLIPMDEFASEHIHTAVSSGPAVRHNQYLEVDSLVPKIDIRALVRAAKDDPVKGSDLDSVVHIFRTIANNPVQLQANSTQRVWFMTGKWWNIDRQLEFDFHQCNWVELLRAQRYLSMRGAR